MFKGLSSIYRDRVDFAEIRETSKDLFERFKVVMTPSIVLMKKNGNTFDQVLIDSEDELTFDNMNAKLQEYALDTPID
jgi:thioredoxin-related protein